MQNAEIIFQEAGLFMMNYSDYLDYFATKPNLHFLNLRMQISFSKYQGAGNDFIMIDGFSESYESGLDQTIVAGLCDRRFGVGADGLIIINPMEESLDFEMLYYNADGRPGTMCGNGGRCAFAFARDLKIISDRTEFLATDGPHEASLAPDGNISLKMSDVRSINKLDEKTFVLDTGSPHFVRIVDDIDAVDVFREGSAIRYSEEYKEKGINVNFIEILSDRIRIATYERGVEDETLACGTGVTAAALVAMEMNLLEGKIRVEAKGGTLFVEAERNSDTGHYEDIWLTGPASKTFEGSITTEDILRK